MKKVSFVVGKDYQNNRIFELENFSLNRDNCLYPFFLLREEFAKRGYELITSDLLGVDHADLVLYNEMPKPFLKNIDQTKSFLMLFETDLIRRDNWDLKKHSHFKKIFTWNDKIIDGEKYFKFNFPNEIKKTPIGLSDRTGFLTSISGNKTSNHPLELYSQRLDTIRWYEENHPESFEYYGIGWDYKFDVWFQKLFRKFKILKFLPKNHSPSYRGRVEEKLTVLRKYKFALCYENGKDIDGYITEKIFDCLFAGAIPIYWGPLNIFQYVPRNCFIDRTQFNSQKELHEFLVNLSDEEILQYQRNIESYLMSEMVKPFSNEFFAKHIVRTLLDE
jgi:hypothetical protein